MSVSPRPAPAPALPPAAHRFDSPSLVRALASLGGIESAPTAQTSAERLSQWLDWTDAIALSAALGQDGTAAQAPTPAPRQVGPLIEHARRARVDLAAAISADPSFAETPADPERCRASYRAHQRQMTARIETTRASLRTALAAQSAEGAQLAALDTVLERALAGRERQLLGFVPSLLDRHLAHTSQNTSQNANSDMHADTQVVAGAVWQDALQAELDTRWQPVDGLIESLRPRPASSP